MATESIEWFNSYIEEIFSLSVRARWGIFFLSCNYDVKDFNLSSQFYYELLQWWSEFRGTFVEEKDYQNIIWNNKDIKIDKNRSISKIIARQKSRTRMIFLFDRDITVAFTHLANKINKTNFLQWAGLRHCIPSQLRIANVSSSTPSPSFTLGNNIFDIKQRRSKDYYSLLVSRKAQHPNITLKLQRDFDFTIDQINQIFLLPHSVAFESYVKASQYKVLNSIFYTNTKICKIGYRSDDLCTFCKTGSETSNHFFYNFSHTRTFWTDFASYWHLLSKKQIHLSLKDVFFGIFRKNALYLIY